jgi:hypothetical protein
MASHRRHEERIPTRVPNRIDCGTQDGRDGMNPTAPGRYRDAGAWADPSSQIEAVQFGPDGGGDVRDTGPAEPLVRAGHPGNGRRDADASGNLLDTNAHGGTPENQWKIAC